MEYGRFEGTLREGNYSAGEIRIWDEASTGPTTNRKNKKGKIKFEFYGSKLRGEFVLVRTVNTEIGY